jgi:glycosyltransferase involved in cell wall biosynthesis
MRVLIPEYNLDVPTWGRFRPQHEALNKYADVYIAHCSDNPPRWIEGYRVPYPPALNDLEAMMKYAQSLVMSLPSFDVLLCRNGGPRRQLLDLMIAKIAGKPAAIKIGGDGRTCRRLVGLGPQRVLHDDVYDDISLNGFDLVIPVSKKMRDVIRGAGVSPNKIGGVVPVGVDKTWTWTSPPEDLILGYAGRLSEEKNLEFLFDVARELPETRFTTVGQILYKRLEFPDNVHHRGSLPYERMPEWIDGITAGVMTSYTEGCPNYILECYLKARPVIVPEGLLSPEIPVWGYELPRDKAEWVHLIDTLPDLNINDVGMMARDFILRGWPSWTEFGELLYDELDRLV